MSGEGIYSTHRFRFQLWKFLLVCNVVVFAAFLVTQALLPGGPLPLIVLFVGCAGISGLLFLLYWLYPIRVGESGVLGYDAAGIFKRVPWDRMRTTAKIGGTIIVRHGRFGSGLWIPWMERQEEFRSAIAQYAPSDNVLLRALSSEK